MDEHHAETAGVMRAILSVTDKMLLDSTGRRYGIVFVVWDPLDPARANFSTNAHRSDVALALKEVATRIVQQTRDDEAHKPED